MDFFSYDKEPELPAALCRSLGFVRSIPVECQLFVCKDTVAMHKKI